MSSLRPILALAAATLLLAACGDDQVSVYKVPKEKEPDLPMAAADSAAPAVPPPARPWRTRRCPGRGGFACLAGPRPVVAEAGRRDAQGQLFSAWRRGRSDLSVTAFPGDVGGELANVNRWRGQIALPPLSQEDLDGAVTRIDQGGLKITLVELAPKGDPNNKAILGAIVPFGGATWFFKLSGPGTSVKAAKPAFLDFLRTVHAP